MTKCNSLQAYLKHLPPLKDMSAGCPQPMVQMNWHVLYSKFGKKDYDYLLPQYKAKI